MNEVIQRLTNIEQALFARTNLPNTSISDSLTIKEAAQMLNYTTGTLYVKTSQKKVPHSKPNGKLIFSRKELENYIESKRVKTVNETFCDVENFATRKIRK